MWRAGPSGLGASAWQPQRHLFKRGTEVRLETWQEPGAHVYVCSCTIALTKGIESH